MKTGPKSQRNNLVTSLALALMAALLAVSGALAANGTLDPTFGTNGLVFAGIGGSATAVHRIALSTDQSKIYALGTTAVGGVQKPVIARYTSGGSVDSSYGTGGQVIIGTSNFAACGFAVQSDGKVVVGGSTGRNNYTVLRYMPNSGTLDSTFGTNGVATDSYGKRFCGFVQHNGRPAGSQDRPVWF